MTRQNPFQACYLFFSSLGNVPSSSKTASQFWNSSRCLVDAHNITSYNFFFGNLLDHFLPEIVHSLHVCCFDRELADFLSASSRGAFHFDLDYFSFQNLRFFFNSDSDRLSERLNTRFFLGETAALQTCVKASVLLMSCEKISEAPIAVKGVSFPSDWAIPIAMAVLPVPGWPAIRTARPAIRPVYETREAINSQTEIDCLTFAICSMTPAPLLAFFWPTMPCEVSRGSSSSERPNPRMCEWADTRSILVVSRTSVRTFESILAWKWCQMRLKRNFRRLKYHNDHVFHKYLLWC